jgi:hypothetical protein
MVTVFNPQALGDPGPTAASGIIGAGLSSATGLIANRKNNQIELLKQLLGTGGTMLGNELERRSEAEQGRTGLKVLQQMGQLPPELQGIDLDKANIDPTTVNTIIAAQSPNKLLSGLNAEANFGKTISEELMKKIVGSQVKKVYIALDNDALKEAIKHCEKLMSYGKEVYLVELDGKDANEIGFEHFLEILENTMPLTFSTLINRKLTLI